MKVLIAVKDEALSKSLESMLGNDNHKVDSRSIDVVAFSDAIRALAPNLIVTDLDAVNEDWSKLGTVIREYQMPCLLIAQDASSGQLINAMRAGVKEVIPLPLDNQLLSDAIARIGVVAESPRPSVGKCIAMISPKGGSGTTFLSANLADTISQEFDKKVLLIDLNLQFGDAVLYVSSIIPNATISEVAKQIKRLDESYLDAAVVKVSEKFHILAAPETPEDAMAVKAEHIKLIISLAKNVYDYVLIDTPSYLSSASVSAMDEADQVYLIIQEALPFVRDCKRLVEALTDLEYAHEKLSLVINRHESGLEMDIDDIEKTIRLPVSHVLPNNFRLASESVNQGIPISRLSSRDALTAALYDFAYEIVMGEPREKRPHLKLWPWGRS